jgi:hypothetical protein
MSRKEQSVRRILVLTVLAMSLVVGTTASAGTTAYAGSTSWPSGQAYSTSFSSSWVINKMYKTASFETAILFIDNVTYGWHSMLRGWGTYQSTHWFSSQVKKAHCRAYTSSSSWAACTAYN